MEFEGVPIEVRSTPAARNSRGYDGRPACAGNTNCVPICPIQAKFDATVVLNRAFASGYVDVMYQTVVTSLAVDTETCTV